MYECVLLLLSAEVTVLSCGDVWEVVVVAAQPRLRSYDAKPVCGSMCVMRNINLIINGIIRHPVRKPSVVGVDMPNVTLTSPPALELPVCVVPRVRKIASAVSDKFINLLLCVASEVRLLKPVSGANKLDSNRPLPPRSHRPVVTDRHLTPSPHPSPNLLHASVNIIVGLGPAGQRCQIEHIDVQQHRPPPAPHTLKGSAVLCSPKTVALPEPTVHITFDSLTKVARHDKKPVGVRKEGVKESVDNSNFFGKRELVLPVPYN